MSEEGGGIWPEQEAVWAWMERHGIELTREQENDLKEAVTQPRLEKQRKAEQLEKLLWTPENEDFAKGVIREAGHQVDRWGVEHDEGKEPQDWFWLIGFLAGKMLRAWIDGNVDKAKHHCISTAAVCANAHQHLSGTETTFRPGLGPAPDQTKPAAPADTFVRVSDEESNAQRALDEAFTTGGDTVNIDLHHPDLMQQQYIEIGLDHVRASDGIRVCYDLGRDGFSIQQPYTTYHKVDGVLQARENWVETAFVQSWALEHLSEDPDDVP